MQTISLPKLLNTEWERLRAFCALLDKEQEILAGGGADLLSGIASEKATLAADLNRLQLERERVLAAAGFPATRAGMEQWIAQCANPDAERERWQAVMNLALKARMTNEANGRLIGMLLRQNQDALAVLSAGGDSIYGPDGQQRSGIGGGRSLGSA